MKFRHAQARQPETIRTVQKDLTYTNELTEDFSDILRIFGSRYWIKYNTICKLVAEIVYHGFASVNNLQTLGEEYTGIIQVDCNYAAVPSKILQLFAILLEFGGEALYIRFLQKLEREIINNERILPDAKIKLKKLIQLLTYSTSYIKALHKTIFYLNSNKYQISKRVSGINYALIRHWIQPDHSLYGYRILGWITLVQLAISVAGKSFDLWKESKNSTSTNGNSPKSFSDAAISATQASHCILCLESRTNTSLTSCGHLFCWSCILEWLDERDECPLCREALKKSNVVQLYNYM